MSSSFYLPRRIHVLGLLGAILLLCGLFLPLSLAAYYGSSSPRNDISSLWSLVMKQIAIYGYDLSSVLLIGCCLIFILLPLLMGILASLLGFFGKEKRVFSVLYLLVVTVGLAEFLLFSYLAEALGVGFWVLLSGFIVSLAASIAQNLQTDLSLLPSFSIPRRAHMLSLLGAACFVSGGFLPWIITNFTEPPLSESTSFWSLSVGAFSSDLRYALILIIQIVFFSLLPTLSFLTGILNSLAELSGKGKRVFSTLYLIITVIGLCNFLISSYFGYCIFYCGATGEFALRGSRIFGSGFWLILAGLIVFLGVSMAQCKLFKSREVLDSL